MFYHILAAGFINLMAFWSYYEARYRDPGKISWHHFREKRLLDDIKNKEKWQLVEELNIPPPPIEKDEKINPNEC